LLRTLHRLYDLDELLVSMAQNGYFDEEPLVAFPRKPLPRSISPAAFSNPQHKDHKALVAYLSDPKVRLVVAEGNRRLASAKILTDESAQRQLRIRSVPSSTKQALDDLKILPVIVYPSRDKVVPYLGVRHITGTRKWESYPKARYVWQLLDEGRDLAELERELGDRAQAIRKSAIAFSMLKQAEEDLGFDTKSAKENFSYLLLSLNQGPIRKFLGITSSANVLEPIADRNLPQLREFLTWVFGEAGKTSAAIRESRDITRLLVHVIASDEAIGALRRGSPLQEAYDYTDGEEQMLLKLLASATRSLERALGVAHRHKTVEVRDELKRCAEAMAALSKSTGSGRR
jgi:hypothetical protein